MNLANMNRLIDHLKKVPRDAFDMGEWFSRVISSDDPLRDEYSEISSYSEGEEVIFEIHPAWAAEVLTKQEGPGPYDCNTVACIAGHAALLATAETKHRPEDIEYYAQDWLGLTNEQATRLFTPFGLTLPEGCHYDDVTPQIAARACEHLRDTGEVDWWGAFSKLSHSS